MLISDRLLNPIMFLMAMAASVNAKAYLVLPTSSCRIPNWAVSASSRFPHSLAPPRVAAALSISGHRQFSSLSTPDDKRIGTTRVFARWVMSLAVCTTVILQTVSDPTATTAHAFEWFGKQQQEIQRDPVEPFTIYGSIFKKYLIEEIVEGKIVARKKGFTASACMNILEASKETPELQSVPAGLKVTLIGDPCCGKGEGKSREDSCSPPCEKACEAAITRHLAYVSQRTGYVLDPADRSRVKESCFNQCFKECTMPGKTISFILPFRPRR